MSIVACVDKSDTDIKAAPVLSTQAKSSSNNSNEAIVLRSEINYWNQTQPSLLEMKRRITPIAETLIDILPHLHQSDPTAWQTLSTELAPDAIPIYQAVVKDYALMKNYAISNLPEMQRARSEEMNAKLAGWIGIESGWITDDDQQITDGWILLGEGAELGRAVDQMRVDLGRRISDGCVELSIPECRSVAK